MEVKQCTIWDQRGYNNTSVHIDMYVCVYVCIYVCLCVCVYNILCVCKLSKQEVDESTTEKTLVYTLLFHNNITMETATSANIHTSQYRVMTY